MSRSRVGLLWDSLTRNTGDQAVGATMLRLARSAGVGSLEPVRLGDSGERYDMMVVGGGEVLHPPGHPFYELFRVAGQHLLCTAGVHGRVDAGYLSEYRLVSVRSEGDRQRLVGLERPVQVVPCLALRLHEVVRDRTVVMPDQTLLVHLHAGGIAPEEYPGLVASLGRLGLPISLLPLMPYNRDRLLLAYLARAGGWAAPLDLAGPDQVYSAIRRSRAALVTSLHGVLFAYQAGIPFLALAYSQKVRDFLAERGLAERIVDRPDRLEAQRHLLCASSVDWQRQLELDLAATRDLTTAVLTIIDEVASQPPRGAIGRRGWMVPAGVRGAHRRMIAVHSRYARVRIRSAAKILGFSPFGRLRVSLRDGLRRQLGELAHRVARSKNRPGKDGDE